MSRSTITSRKSRQTFIQQTLRAGCYSEPTTWNTNHIHRSGHIDYKYSANHSDTASAEEVHAYRGLARDAESLSPRSTNIAKQCEARDGPMSLEGFCEQHKTELNAYVMQGIKLEAIQSMGTADNSLPTGTKDGFAGGALANRDSSLAFRH
eukprot:2658687-Amphidinium_carterae.1